MSVTQNNVFVHSSPPKAISSSGAAIRQLVKNGDIEKLEAAVLDGQGARLLGLAETTSDTKVKGFLRSVPGLMAKVDLIHDAVIRGSVRETQALLDKKKLAGARDAVGRGLAHKAVLHSNKSVIEWLGKKYPDVLNLRDNESRTCLHYAAACRDAEEMYDFLVSLGANPDLADIHGRKPEYYIKHQDEFDIEGPTRSLSRGKRRKISPTTTPPRKIMSSPPSITRAQIRILIHEKDIPKLEKIVWSGHGEKLLLETTNNSKVRRFLDNVPHLLSRIKSIHTAAINNDVDFLKDVRRKTELTEVFMAKDSHGLTPLHKAAGLSNRAVLEYLIYEMPALIHEPDTEGRVPLHFGAKDSNVYTWIMKAGGNENITDQKGKTPAYYRTHQGELDTRYLRNIPDAPRVTGDLSGWDRASPIVNQTRRRPSVGEFSNLSNSRDDSGKYGLSENIELREEEFIIDEMMESDFKPRDDTNIIIRNGLMSSATTKINNNDFDNDFDDSSPPPPSEIIQEIELIPQKEILSEDQIEEKLLTAEEEMFDMITEPEGIPSSSNNVEEIETIDPIENETTINTIENEGIDDAVEIQATSPIENEVINATTEIELIPESESELVVEAEPEPEADVEEIFGIGLDEVMPDESIFDPEVIGESTEPDYIELENQDVEEEVYEGGSTKYIESGTDIEIALKNRNMEALVDMILDGRGSELLNQQTEHPELKDFLSNVPAYMAKMSSIHNAAAAGNLRDLQSLLDRKRLALAKDHLGRSPLHQAVLHNHINVARHLASTYPQSLRSLDANGRSPLHYAATLPDSGSLYKYLVNLGADPNVKDLNGNTPGIYLRNRDLLSNKDLIMAGAAAEITMAEKVLQNQMQQVQNNSEVVDHWERPETPPDEILYETEIKPVDIPSKFVTLVRMKLCRNIKPFPLLPIMKKDDLNIVACAMKTVQFNWPCFDLEVLDKEIREELKNRCWIPEATNVSRFWPKFRYFFLSHDNNAQIWMNAEDHLTILVTSRYGRLFPMLETLNDIYLQYATRFEFYKLNEIGYVTVDPFKCGSGFTITFRIRLPTLMRDKTEVANLAAELNLSLSWKNSSLATDYIAPDDWIELENKSTMGIDEIVSCKQMVESINRLIKLEEERARMLILTENKK